MGEWPSRRSSQSVARPTALEPMTATQSLTMGLTKVVVLVGAGVAGSVILRNGRVAEILGELQEILDKGSKGKSGGLVDGDAELNEALSSCQCCSYEIPKGILSIWGSRVKGLDVENLCFTH